MNDARLSIVIPADLLKRINELAEKKCISAASLVRMAMVEFLNKEETDDGKRV